jgi:hypothetical protein
VNWGLSSNGTETRIKLQQPLDLKAFDEPQFTASAKAGQKLKFSVRGQGPMKTYVNRGFCGLISEGFLAIPSLPSNTVPLLLEPLIGI